MPMCALVWMLLCTGHRATAMHNMDGTRAVQVSSTGAIASKSTMMRRHISHNPRSMPGRTAMLERERVLPASIGKAYADTSQGTASQSSIFAFNASWAIDGNESTHSFTKKERWNYWQWESNTRLKVTGVRLKLAEHGLFGTVMTILVDHQICGMLHEWDKMTWIFLACNTPLFGKTVRLQETSGEKQVLAIAEIQIQEEPSGRYDVTPEEVRGTICPWVSIMLNMKKLRGCWQTNQTLLDVAVASGLPERVAQRHIAGNFLNNPSGEQDVCNMEGALNEHKTSTRINDCRTVYEGCTPHQDGKPAVCEKVTTNTTTCGIPDAREFDEFWSKIKDGDTSPYVSAAEIRKNAHLVPIIDENPVAVGTLGGSFTLMLAIFGFNVFIDGDKMDALIHRDSLAEVLLQRIFPSNGYRYGVPKCINC